MDYRWFICSSIFYHIKDSIKTKTNSDLPFPAGFISNDDRITTGDNDVSVSKENIELSKEVSENTANVDNEKVRSEIELDKSNKDHSK